MGQKVHPYGFRLGFNKPWRSRWFAKQDYAKLLQEDVELRETLRERLKSAGVSSIEVDRPGNKLRVTIRTSRPGIIIGRKGAEIEKLKLDLAKRTKREVFIDIQEVHKPELDAQLVSESIALQLEKRVDRKSTRLNSSHLGISYAVFCLKKKKPQPGFRNEKESWVPVLNVSLMIGHSPTRKFEAIVYSCFF